MVVRSIGARRMTNEMCCRENNKLHIGNINKSSFTQIWDSQNLKNLEGCINASNCNTFCKSLKINNLIHSIKNPSTDYSQNFF